MYLNIIITILHKELSFCASFKLSILSIVEFKISCVSKIGKLFLRKINLSNFHKSIELICKFDNQNLEILDLVRKHTNKKNKKTNVR